MITTGVRYKHGGNPVDCGDNYVCQEVAAECDECYEYRTEGDVVGYLYSTCFISFRASLHYCL